MSEKILGVSEIQASGDVEAQLIRASRWEDLRKYYLSGAGNSWGLAWIAIQRDRDLRKAVEYLRQASLDPRFEAAASILLMKLMPRSKSIKISSHVPASFRLYLAFQNKEVAPLIAHLKESPSDLWAILDRVKDRLTEAQVAELAALPRSTEVSFLLGEICDRRLGNQTLAHRFYREFCLDPWSKNIVDEIRRIVGSEEKSRGLRHAYAQRSPSSIRKWLQNFHQDLMNLDPSLASKSWKQTVAQAVKRESDAIEAHLSGYAFWQDQEWSPTFIEELRQKLFPVQASKGPDFVTLWSRFLEAEDWKPIDLQLGENERAIWQINVELAPEVLSEALLKFPEEERFLVHWTARRAALSSADKRLWPQNEQESQVVRKNLERAFEKAENKVVWFDRLRKSGCSQSFYEYALSRVDVPLDWIVSDLETNIISATAEIRGHLAERASVLVPGDHIDLHRVIHFLTPAETQEVLVSRFILSEIPENFLGFETAELLWEARSRVTPEIRSRWERAIGHYVLSQDLRSLKSTAWNWLIEIWDTHPEFLARTPTITAASYPWSDYLEAVHRHQKDSLVSAVKSCPIVDLKLSWAPVLLELGADLREVLSAAPPSPVKYHWLAESALKRGDLGEALSAWDRALEEEPVINAQLATAERALRALLEKHGTDHALPEAQQMIGRYAAFLDLHGRLSFELCRELCRNYERVLAWPESWRWAQQVWVRASDFAREEALETLLRVSFGARLVSDAQRILVDYVFKQDRPSHLLHRIFSKLLASDSEFRLHYLRREFIEKASQLFPLHSAILRERASWDYRAWLLWQAFYGESLERHPDLPRVEGKRNFTLWGLVHVPSQPELFASFLKYFDFSPQKPIKSSEVHDFLGAAQRILRRAAKIYGSHSKPDVILVKNFGAPIKITTNPAQLIVDYAFFDELDEEIWHALCVGFIQIFEDRRAGLFDERRVVERYFQGMMISGVSIAKLIRFWTWLAMSEELIDPMGLQQNPEGLIEKLPFMNALLIFYLSKDMELKLASSGLLPS